MSTIAVSAKSGSLATFLKITSTNTTILVQSKESWVGVIDGVVEVGSADNREWCSFTSQSETFDSGTGIYDILLAGVTRGLKKNAANYTDALSANKKTNAIGQPVALVFHSVDINGLVSETGNNTFSGNNTVTGSFTFVSTTIGQLRLQNVTTVQRLALTGLQDGVLVYDTTTGEPYIYAGGAWYALSTGSVQPNATESVKGIVQLATVADQINATAIGSTGAGLVLQAKNLITISAGGGDQGRIALLDASGHYDVSVLPTSLQKFGGDGSDGAIGAGNLTITGSNDTYIVKNYTSFAPNNTVTVTPTGCIVHIKISGDANLTSTTFDFAGKGAQGGSGGGSVTGNGGTNVAGNSGTIGNTGIATYVHSLGGGSGGGGPLPPTGGTAGVFQSQTFPLSTDLNSIVLGGRSLPFGPGSGGGGGGSGGTSIPITSVSGAGGAGGHGGGCLIIEVAGDITFSSTVINANGTTGSNGGNASDPTNNAGGGGGGGGGSGGTVIILYNGSVTGLAPTPNVAGGTGGTGGSSVNNDPPNARSSGGAGAGGTSQYSNGTSGTAGASTASTGGNGGTGAAGQYLIAKNTVFQ